MWRLKQSARPEMVHSLRIKPECYLPGLANSELILHSVPAQASFLPSFPFSYVDLHPFLALCKFYVSVTLGICTPSSLSVLFPRIQSQWVTAAVLVHGSVG